MQRFIITASTDRSEYGMQPWFDFAAELTKARRGDGQARLKTHDTEDHVLDVVKEFYAEDWDAAREVYEATMRQDD